jgi:hypothetical protein
VLVREGEQGVRDRLVARDADEGSPVAGRLQVGLGAGYAGQERPGLRDGRAEAVGDDGDRRTGPGDEGQ